jgi:transcriptional regulator with XRE-family HTH domain
LRTLRSLQNQAIAGRANYFMEIASMGHNWMRLWDSGARSAQMPRRSQNVPETYSAYERTLAHAMGERLRQRRKQLGLLQEQVRDRLNVEQVHISRTQYSRIETGESLLRTSEIIALVGVLECTCAWLLFGEERHEENSGIKLTEIMQKSAQSQGSAS